ncbi:hypothetical protein [Paraburkholderia sp.]|uniref:hypothetical protein n=1 Tax=Paraburkholderia sp. TaxID=1926495 RepID=UPI003D6FC9C7
MQLDAVCEIALEQSDVCVPAQRPEAQFALDLSRLSDRQIVADALQSLLRERSDALHLAMRIAADHRRPLPDASDYGLSDILRLRRLMGLGAAGECVAFAMSFT